MDRLLEVEPRDENGLVRRQQDFVKASGVIDLQSWTSTRFPIKQLVSCEALLNAVLFSTLLQVLAGVLVVGIDRIP